MTSLHFINDVRESRFFANIYKNDHVKKYLFYDLSTKKCFFLNLHPCSSATIDNFWFHSKFQLTKLATTMAHQSSQLTPTKHRKLVDYTLHRRDDVPCSPTSVCRPSPRQVLMTSTKSSSSAILAAAKSVTFKTEGKHNEGLNENIDFFLKVPLSVRTRNSEQSRRDLLLAWKEKHALVSRWSSEEEEFSRRWSYNDDSRRVQGESRKERRRSTLIGQILRSSTSNLSDFGSESSTSSSAASRRPLVRSHSDKSDLISHNK